VWVDNRGQQIPGQISQSTPTPRSYIVETPSGELRRNRAHLRTRSGSQIPGVTDGPDANDHCQPVTRLQAGKTIQPPDRLRY